MLYRKKPLRNFINLFITYNFYDGSIFFYCYSCDTCFDDKMTFLETKEHFLYLKQNFFNVSISLINYFYLKIFENLPKQDCMAFCMHTFLE